MVVVVVVDVVVVDVELVDVLVVGAIVVDGGDVVDAAVAAGVVSVTVGGAEVPESPPTNA